MSRATWWRGVSGVLIVLLLSAAGLEAGTSPASLTFADRLGDAEAVERVLHSHRTWPGRAAERPRFEEVVSREALRRKVEDALRLSDALERFWSRPLTAEQLQAELDRMVRGSKQPEVLREMFSALGDDPARIVEALVRPALARRVAEDLYAQDPRLHGALRRQAEEAVRQVTAPGDLARLGVEYARLAYRRGGDGRVPALGPGEARLGPVDWDALRARLARRFAEGPLARIRPDDPLPVGRVARLHEDADAFTVLAVLEDGGDRLVTGAAVWRKTPFTNWWTGVRDRYTEEVPVPDATYRLDQPEAGCTDGTWTPTRFEAPDPRQRHTAVWTGAEMIVWGGERNFSLDTGGRYTPATDSWALTTQVGAPEIRSRHTAVWTGTRMLIWGGFRPYASLTSGGSYDPVTDSWTPISTTGVPTARQDHTAVWTGTEMVVWGGINETSFARYNTGGRYNPVTDSWTATATTGAPSGRDLHTAVWSGTEMIVFGGNDAGLTYRNDGGRYRPASNSWVAMTPLLDFGRTRHSSVWAGTEMIVFGGYNGVSHLNTGHRYNPTTNAWTAIPATGAPSARGLHTAVWSGSQMIVWGGWNGTTYLNDGASYAPSTNTWTAMTTDAPGARSGHAAVWTGTEMLTWGGLNDTDYLVFGARYVPATNVWTLMSAGTSVPAARYGHSAVWTGSEMVVYGGANEYLLGNTTTYLPATDTWTALGPATGIADRWLHLAAWTGREMIVYGGYGSTAAMNSGGRYDPVTDLWTPTGTGPGVPVASGQLAGVWDGSGLVVWGGWDGVSAPVATGGRYVPATDSWTAVSAAGSPGARAVHTAVWNGTEMLVFGGYDGAAYLNTGARYNPRTDTWSAMTPTGSPRGFHVAVWTGDRMIVQGGYDGAADRSDGWRYDPATDAWSALPAGFAARDEHTAVWTGSEMITFGGWAGSSPGSGGSRYNPATNVVTALPITGGPSGRARHSAVWTGERMIVWGGAYATSTGGAFCAVPACTVATWYRDYDADGFGNFGDPLLSCPQPAGYVAAGADCNDASAAAFPGAPEVCDGLDNDCNASVDDVALPGPITALAAGKTGDTAELSWPSLVGATSYDVVRGSLGLLRSSAGDFAASTDGCLADDTASTAASDPGILAPGEGTWHLVRGANCGGVGTYDSGAASQAGTRDAEITASASACP